jgi:hypothetical protein
VCECVRLVVRVCAPGYAGVGAWFVGVSAWVNGCLGPGVQVCEPGRAGVCA